MTEGWNLLGSLNFSFYKFLGISMFLTVNFWHFLNFQNHRTIGLNNPPCSKFNSFLFYCQTFLPFMLPLFTTLLLSFKIRPFFLRPRDSRFHLSFSKVNMICMIIKWLPRFFIYILSLCRVSNDSKSFKCSCNSTFPGLNKEFLPKHFSLKVLFFRFSSTFVVLKVS